MEPQVTFLGAVLATLFAISMGSLLWWMLHPPAQIKPAVAKARHAVGAFKRILVPTTGVAYAEKAIELACRLGVEQKAEIVLTYVLEIPRTLPLEASMPQAEKEADEALERGKEIVELHNLIPIKRLERAREAGEGIVKLARENDVDAIVLGIRPSWHGSQNIWGKTTEILLKKAPCEVIFDKLPE
ncbi:MAG TPA: universal stress protein [candidate division Zixibacteria bacterium]